MIVLRALATMGSLACIQATLAQGLNIGLEVQHISVALTTESIIQNQASLNFDISNAMSSPATITQMSATVGILGNTILSFDQTFDSFVVPASGTANSGIVSNVTLTEGPLSLIQIILLPALDIINAAVTVNMQQSGIPSK
ncbi:hypothetical protein M0805_003163 [Coniferiporia weirii]|nr:hypothetical protein M0805_003163 [Coniferiporia weirii]